MSEDNLPRIAFIGCGNIGKAILRRIIEEKGRAQAAVATTSA
jgi:pyrroline-5-carboxylate reductase